jgi:alpha-beta hydrolase superfamily lysophospholipase
MTTPVLLIVGDEDAACLETNLMLKATLPNAGLWISPNTGHTINLEEPAAFNAHLEAFLGAVERRSWRRSYAMARIASRRLSLEHRPEISTPIHIGQERSDNNVIALHQGQSPY